MCKMHPDGYWMYHGKGDEIAYATPGSTHYVLAYLAELGMDRSDPRIARAVERYLALETPQRENLAYWEIPPDYRSRQSCLYAYNLRTLVMLGYRGEQPVRERAQVLLEDVRHDGGYLCDRTSWTARTKSCIRGSIKALMAYAALPELWETERCRQLVNYFLRRRVYYRSRQPDQIIRGELIRTGFPFVINGSLLEPLYALSVMGYGQHPALEDAWARLATKRDAQGRYVNEWYPTGIPFKPDVKGQPSKWVTVYAALALKAREATSG